MRDWARLGFVVLILSALSIPLSGCSSIPANKWSAVGGQTADTVTTLVGVGSGLAEEANPIIIAAPLLLLVKPFLPWMVHRWSDDFYTCRDSLVGLSHIGWGAALWNVGVLVGAPVVGAVIGVGSAFVFHDHRVNSASLYCIDKPTPFALDRIDRTGVTP